MKVTYKNTFELHATVGSLDAEINVNFAIFCGDLKIHVLIASATLQVKNGQKFEYKLDCIWNKYIVHLL